MRRSLYTETLYSVRDAVGPRRRFFTRRVRKDTGSVRWSQTAVSGAIKAGSQSRWGAKGSSIVPEGFGYACG